MRKAIRPASMTSIGSTIACAPASLARATAASASSVDTYVDHTGGWFSSIRGATPATRLPRSRNIA
jgi:hypothetical protein